MKKPARMKKVIWWATVNKRTGALTEVKRHKSDLDAYSCGFEKCGYGCEKQRLARVEIKEIPTLPPRSK